MYSFNLGKNLSTCSLEDSKYEGEPLINLNRAAFSLGKDGDLNLEINVKIIT